MVGALAGLAVAGSASIYQSILAGIQKNKADKINVGERPTYEIPSAEKASLDLTRMLAGSNAPGYNIAKADIEGAGANNLLTGIKFGGADVSQTYKNQTDALSDLNAGNEAFRERQLNNLTSKLSEFAGYQDKAFDINKMQPYEYALQQKKDLQDASNQNFYGALGNLSSAGLEYMKTFQKSEKTAATTDAGGAILPDNTGAKIPDDLAMLLKNNPELAKSIAEYIQTT